MISIALLVLGWLIVIIIGKFVSEEAVAWSRRWQSLILKRSASALPATHRERYLQEWLAELEAIPNGPVTRSLWVIKIFIGTREMSQALGGPVRMRRMDAGIKRTQDVILAFGLIVFLSPTLLAICIAVKLTSRGPVFFRQTRIGIDGEPFSMIEFRTMYINAPPRQAAMLESDRSPTTLDPRLTRFGSFLRSFAIDELPQLFNVIRGDMSLVGPRPALLSEALVPHQPAAVVSVKPGMTGIWATHGTTVPRRAERGRRLGARR